MVYFPSGKTTTISLQEGTLLCHVVLPCDWDIFWDEQAVEVHKCRERASGARALAPIKTTCLLLNPRTVSYAPPRTSHLTGTHTRARTYSLTCVGKSEKPLRKPIATTSWEIVARWRGEGSRWFS